MYEKLKVGTVIEFKEDGKQFIFVGYESPFILIFYLYSPDMLKSFDLDKQERLLLGFEKEYPYRLKKQLDEKRLKAWYIKSRMTHSFLPMLKDSGLDSIKEVKNFSEINVFDLFLLDYEVYVYLGMTFQNEYICYCTGKIDRDKQDVIMLESCNLTTQKLCILTEQQIKENKEYLYFIKHLTSEQIKGMQGLRYGELLF